MPDLPKIEPSVLWCNGAEIRFPAHDDRARHFARVVLAVDPFLHDEDAPRRFYEISRPAPDQLRLVLHNTSAQTHARGFTMPADYSISLVELLGRLDRMSKPPTLSCTP